MNQRLQSTVLLLGISLLLMTASGCTTPRITDPNVTSTALIDDDADITQTEDYRETLAGTWYLKQYSDQGDVIEQVTTYSLNGRFDGKTRIRFSDGETHEYEEFGLWGVSGDIYFHIYTGEKSEGKFEAYDGRSPRYYWAYRILQLNGETFHYQTVSTGNLFTSTRHDRYSFPDSDQSAD